jgi:hypothetical protein
MRSGIVTTKVRHCAFCNRSSDETRMAALAGANICTACIHAAIELRDGFVEGPPRELDTLHCSSCGFSEAELGRTRLVSFHGVLRLAAKIIAGESSAPDHLAAKDGLALCRACLSLSAAIAG